MLLATLLAVAVRSANAAMMNMTGNGLSLSEKFLLKLEEFRGTHGSGEVRLQAPSF
jgi:hypothetical protein